PHIRCPAKDMPTSGDQLCRTDGSDMVHHVPVQALLLENPHENADAALEAAGLEVVRHTGAMDEDELIAALDGVQVLGIRSKTSVTRRVLEAAPALLTIGAFCIGTNQVDVATAAHRGVAVFNAPFSNTRSVVELTLGEI